MRAASSFLLLMRFGPGERVFREKLCVVEHVYVRTRFAIVTPIYVYRKLALHWSRDIFDASEFFSSLAIHGAIKTLRIILKSKVSECLFFAYSRVL